MDQSRRSSLAFGIILILLGAAFLAYQLVPGLQILVDWGQAWPLIIVGIGVVLLLMAVLAATPGLAVPATIVCGVGGLLWWQNVTGHWETWSFAWSLIPGFIGVGIILSGLLSGRVRESLIGGSWMVLISLILFFIFGSFLGGLELFGAYWPILLIGLGLLMLIGPLLRSRG
ncbi:MAG: hypothetical protein M1546_08255 [Chloroflexi bacterium]|nr:hypothetical protein [Chloroflexota bacterium]